MLAASGLRFGSSHLNHTLRGRAWAVDSYLAFNSRPREPNPLVVVPVEVTLTDAPEALQQCRPRWVTTGRGHPQFKVGGATPPATRGG
ncbi:MAG TPA: hypothetical protein VHQ03_00100 [Candidatus Dormibacteraeota bacterium]|nr:hypothetical protein [Candidatus Dormibacteraeota bacterium]